MVENKPKGGGENRWIKMKERAICSYISSFLQHRNDIQCFIVFFSLTSFGKKALYGDIE